MDVKHPDYLLTYPCHGLVMDREETSTRHVEALFPSLICLIVSVDVKYHGYLLTYHLPMGWSWTGRKQVHDMWRRCLLTAAQSSAPPSGAQRGLPTDHRTVLQKSSHTTAAALGKSSGRRAAAANTTSDPAFAGLPFEPDYNPTDPEGPGAHLAIVPGTRWCGNGNIASSYEDLGM